MTTRSTSPARPAASDDVGDRRATRTTGGRSGRTSNATPDQVERAVAAAAAVAAEAAALPAHARAAALDHVSRRLAERADEVAALITAENGKPLKWARAEVGRAVSTFRWAAEEARRFSGELQRLDTDPAATGRMALVTPRAARAGARHQPVQLPAEPGRAQGRPGDRGRRADRASSRRRPPRCPRCCSASCWPRPTCPAGMFSVLPVPNDRAAALVADPRLPVVSFTGSGPVGAPIRGAVPRQARDARAGRQRGGAWSARTTRPTPTWTGRRSGSPRSRNYQAGQSCIAVQRVYRARVALRRVPAPARRGGRGAAAPATRPTRTTDVGPMISEDAARRVEAWVDEAVAAGGTRAGRRPARRRHATRRPC